MEQKITEIIADIRNTLAGNIDSKTLQSSERFFKEKVKPYGVKVSIVSQISKEVFSQIKSWTKADIFTLCDKLWQSGYLEEGFMAANFSYFIKKRYEPADFAVFEKWVNHYISNWATCDTLCNHTLGTFLEMFPEYVSELKKWALSDNRWVKRAAAVSLIIPARRGLFQKDIFNIADTLLLDKDDMVQKGYGWMLKAASEADQERVFDYVMSKKNVMPRTSLRYAIEKMPQELRAKAMAK